MTFLISAIVFAILLVLVLVSSFRSQHRYDRQASGLEQELPKIAALAQKRHIERYGRENTAINQLDLGTKKKEDA